MKERKTVSIKPEAARLLTEISRLLAARNIRAYIVGGFIRDTLLGGATADIDIAVDADALEVAAGAADYYKGKYVPLDDLNLVRRVIIPDSEWHLDFTTIKGDIKEDLAHRDFTINALAYELGENFQTGIELKLVIDPFAGRRDLELKLVRALNDNIFQDDAARLLRALRIAAGLGFNIESSTEKLILRDSQLITSVAGERVREEFLRLLALPGAGKRLFQMDKLGLLTALFPEIIPAKGVDQPRAHVFDVFEHSIQTVSAVEFVLREADWEYGNEKIRSTIPWSEKLESYFNRVIGYGSTGKTILKLSALLHDIAKPQTKFMDEGRARFLGHQDEGAAVAVSIMERLRFSKREIQLVELLIKNHLRPTQMSHEGMPSNRAIYRFFRDIGEAGIDTLFLSLADHLAARAATLDIDEWQWHAQMAAYVLEKHFEEAGPTSQPRIIDGREIMESLGIPAGPAVGELLEALKEAQADGEVRDKSKAIDYLKQLYHERYKNTPN